MWGTDLNLFSFGKGFDYQFLFFLFLKFMLKSIPKNKMEISLNFN